MIARKRLEGCKAAAGGGAAHNQPLRGLAGVLILSLLAGCLRVKEHLTLKLDGSGTLVLETQSPVQPALLRALRQQGGFEAPFAWYPPLTKSDAERLFPGKDFEVTVKDNTGKDAASGVIVRVAFKDINALMASPYGQARSLCVERKGNRLHVTVLSGLMPAIAAGEAGFAQMYPAAAKLGKKKRDMVAEFRITLPGPVQSSNGAHHGSTATWVLDRSKTKNLAEATKRFGMAMRATCTAAGLRCTPAPPPRLGLVAFRELKEGPAHEKLKAPDVKAITAAARFVPCTLRIRRVFNVTGKGSGAVNEAVLVGAIVLPMRLAPARWGALHVEKILDDRGNSLKPGGERSSRYGRSFGIGPYGASAPAAPGVPSGGRGQRKPATEARHFLSFGFQVPDRGVRKLAHIQGSITLEYFGSRHIIKLPNAIPKAQVRDLRKPGTRVRFRSSVPPAVPAQAGRRLAHPKLAELGLKATVDDVMRSRGVTHFSLEVEAPKAALDEVQLFDAHGMPWPTLANLRDVSQGQGTCYVMVPGSPEAPFSLALLVKSGRIAVKIPIKLENVPLSGPPKPSGAKETRGK